MKNRSIPVKIKDLKNRILYLRTATNSFCILTQLGELQPVISVEEYEKNKDSYEIIY